MKKVIFICLLSLSTCLSRPDGTPAATSTPLLVAHPEATKEQPAVPPATPEIAPPHTETQTTAQNAPSAAAAVPAPVPAATATQSQAPTEGVVSSTPNHIASTTTDKTKTVIDVNKTTDKKNPATKEDTTVDPSKAGHKQESVTPQANPGKTENAITLENKNAKTPETTTLKPDVTPKSTEAPKASDTPTLQARGFDGPSFMGGIILTLGLLAIGFMGFKYYKNQTERNYHTL